MLVQILTTALIILGVYIFREWYLIPKKLMNVYAENLKKRGYRVHHIPYNPFYLHFLAVIDKPKQEGDSLRILRQEYPKYDVVVTNLTNRPFLQFCHPDFIKDFYSVDKHYSYPKNKKALDFITRITGIGLPFSEGKQWKRKRTSLNAVFNFDFLKSQTENIAQICDDSMTKFEGNQNLQAKQIHKTVQYNILQLTMQIFSQVILTSFLGLKTDEKIEGISVAVFLKNIVDDAVDIGLDFPSLLLGEKLMNLGIRKMDRSINRRVAAYRAWAIQYIRLKIKKISSELANGQNKKDASDIIQALMMQKGKPSQSITSEDELFSEFTTFFFAATDTTSNFTQMMIYYIVLHQNVEKKLREQIQTYMKKDDYSYENLKNFNYIDNIQKQVTRMYGPGIFLFLRQAQEDNYIGDLPIKKGTFATVVHQGNHYSDKYFKDPLEFRPERWDSQCDNIPPFVVGGFSGGARTCIGKHLALLQNKIAIIKFMKRYKEIILPNKNFKMSYKFLPCPEYFKTKMVLAQ